MIFIIFLAVVKNILQIVVVKLERKPAIAPSLNLPISSLYFSFALLKAFSIISFNCKKISFNPFETEKFLKSSLIVNQTSVIIKPITCFIPIFKLKNPEALKVSFIKGELKFRL